MKESAASEKNAIDENASPAFNNRGTGMTDERIEPDGKQIIDEQGWVKIFFVRIGLQPLVEPPANVEQ